MDLDILKIASDTKNMKKLENFTLFDLISAIKDFLFKGFVIFT